MWLTCVSGTCVKCDGALHAAAVKLKSVLRSSVGQSSHFHPLLPSPPSPGALHHHVGPADHVVRHILPPRVPWLLLWVSQTTLRAPGEDQSDPQADPRSSVVPHSSSQVCVRMYVYPLCVHCVVTAKCIICILLQYVAIYC